MKINKKKEKLLKLTADLLIGIGTMLTGIAAILEVIKSWR